MKADELKQLAKELYGNVGWIGALAGALGVDISTVRRWTNGVVPVPNPVAAAVRCFVGQHRLQEKLKYERTR